MRYIIFLLIILSSCSVLRKSKEISKTDSTSHTVEVQTLSAQIDSNRLTKSGSESETEVTIEFGDEGIYTPFKDTANDDGIYIYPKQPGDFFTITSEGEVKTNRPVKKVTIKGKQNSFNYDSLSGHSKIDANEINETDKTVSIKTVTKEKKSVVFPWWCWFIILIIPVYLVYRNRAKIKSFFIHKVTGL